MEQIEKPTDNELRKYIIRERNVFKLLVVVIIIMVMNMIITQSILFAIIVLILSVLTCTSKMSEIQHKIRLEIRGLE